MSIVDDFRFDKRVIERNLSSGKITQEEYEKHLKALEDTSDDGSPLESKLTAMDRELPAGTIGEEDE